jgi:flavin-dependent thymidylate synthase
MKINLAGYNVDVDALNDPAGMGAKTPETISAAYARISRSPKTVEQLRHRAAEDVEKARESNETIVFEYGHASVAEHAVFNFDIMEVSRLAIESIEHARLASYTEKSQRYLKLKGLDEVHMPSEMQNARGPFKALMEAQMNMYHDLLRELKAHAEEHGRPQGGSPEEDARYVTGLAVTGQLGMTINARSLETMVRRLVSHPLEEVQLIGHALHSKAVEVAPSLLRYCEPERVRQWQGRQFPALHTMAESSYAVNAIEPPAGCGLHHGADEVVLAGLMYLNSQAPYSACLAVVHDMAMDDRWRHFCRIYERMELHSAAPRCFELPGVVFELVGSASFFAQLKRHRMATVLPQAYDVNLGVTVPQAVLDAGCEEQFRRIQAMTEKTHRDYVDQCGPEVAEYCLMQAHCRRVLVRMNARELYAFSRLREDGHAQWEIRAMAKDLIRQARETMPMTLALACGKDEFKVAKKYVLDTSWDDQVPLDEREDEENEASEE